MPKNTKVYRCVHTLKKKMEIGKAIAICQKSTKLNYRTGKKLKYKKNKKHIRKTRKTGKTRKTRKTRKTGKTGKTGKR